jgi:DtxR family transcriptional regulator, Mn-dependent transcriptional regulator
MATSTVENYIKTIYLECRKIQQEMLPIGRLAQSLNVVPGTATTMVKSLHEAGLVDYEPWVGTRLTHQGEVLALHVLRRHRLVELFLVEILKMDWSEIHDEAEHLEHVISDRVLEKIDDILGHPHYDPHGDPIPSHSGQLKERKLQNLIHCDPGQETIVARVLDQEADFLQFAEKNGLVPGKSVKVLHRDEIANSIKVETASGNTLTLGNQAAVKFEVQ